MLSSVQQKVLVLISPFVGALSILGSSIIVYIIIRDRKSKMKDIFHRLILSMSICDIMNSIRCSLSSLPMPRDVPGIYASMGTTKTCEVAGFFTQFSLNVPIYFGYLALYFLLKICYNKGEIHISATAELCMHLFSLLFPLVTALIAYYKDMYNPFTIGVGCWISSYPPGCSDMNGIECKRGKNAASMAWWTSGIPTLVLIFFLSWCMIRIIHWSIRAQDYHRRNWTMRSLAMMQLEQLNMDIYSFESSLAAKEHFTMKNNCSDNFSCHSTRGSRSRLESTNSSKSLNAALLQARETAVQAKMYIACFFLTSFWTCIFRIVNNSELPEKMRNASLFISAMSQLFSPLQGFFTFLIYIRPMVRRIREDNPTPSYTTLVYKLLCKGLADGDDSGFYETKSKVEYYSAIDEQGSNGSSEMDNTLSETKHSPSLDIENDIGNNTNTNTNTNINIDDIAKRYFYQNSNLIDITMSSTWSETDVSTSGIDFCEKTEGFLSLAECDAVDMCDQSVHSAFSSVYYKPFFLEEATDAGRVYTDSIERKINDGEARNVRNTSSNSARKESIMEDIDEGIVQAQIHVPIRTVRKPTNEEADKETNDRKPDGKDPNVCDWRHRNNEYPLISHQQEVSNKERYKSDKNICSDAKKKSVYYNLHRANENEHDNICFFKSGLECKAHTTELFDFADSKSSNVNEIKALPSNFRTLYNKTRESQVTCDVIDAHKEKSDKHLTTRDVSSREGPVSSVSFHDVISRERSNIDFSDVLSRSISSISSLSYNTMSDSGTGSAESKKTSSILDSNDHACCICPAYAGFELDTLSSSTGNNTSSTQTEMSGQTDERVKTINKTLQEMKDMLFFQNLKLNSFACVSNGDYDDTMDVDEPIQQYEMGALEEGMKICYDESTSMISYINEVIEEEKKGVLDELEDALTIEFDNIEDVCCDDRKREEDACYEKIRKLRTLMS